jgi:stringent starvation protein B
MEASERPSKQEAFAALLNEGWVSLHIDARRPGVVVPTPFSSQAHLILQYGRNMPLPIPDLEVTPAGISATLSFARVPHRTYVPWSAVYIVACTNGAGVLYQEDVPPEVSLVPASEAPAAEQPAPSTAPVEPPAARPRLRSVPAEGAEHEDSEAVALDDDCMVMRAQSRRRSRPQLRLVK